MNTFDRNMQEIFNTESIQEIVEFDDVTEVINNLECDADFARENIRSLILKGTKALDNLSNVAKESEQPRAYEVSANLIKVLSDLNKDLMEIQKRKKELDGTIGKQELNVDKAIFLRSTSELVKFLKHNKQEQS